MRHQGMLRLDVHPFLENYIRMQSPAVLPQPGPIVCDYISCRVIDCYGIYILRREPGSPR